MELLPIKKDAGGEWSISGAPDCQEILQMTIDFYDKVGFEPPGLGITPR